MYRFMPGVCVIITVILYQLRFDSVSISSGRAGKKSISALFSTLLHCYHIFLQWLMVRRCCKNKSYGLRIFLIIYQYDFIESMGTATLLLQFFCGV